MVFEFRFQDPVAGSTKYLDELILDRLADEQVEAIDGIFAFATVRGVLAVVGDVAFSAYLERGGRFSLLVGLDAITDRGALQVLLEASLRLGGGLVVRAYKNEQSGLFHPKLLRVKRFDGSIELVVGSGNLTPGGLRSNIEAFASYRGLPGGLIDGEWDRFLEDHAAEISPIDHDALERGARNAERNAAARAAARTGRAKRRGRVREEEPEATTEGGTEVELAAESSPTPESTDRMLVAYVPKAGGRWHQVHLNVDVIAQFFKARPNSPDRVRLARLEAGGTVVHEPPRRVLLSEANKNHRVEFGAAAGVPYPTSGPPIIVLRELGLRSFNYVMLMPDEPGYEPLSKLLASSESIGKGVARTIKTRKEVTAAWGGLPL